MQEMESITLEPNGNQEMFHPESEEDTQIANILKPETETEISHLQLTESITLEPNGNEEMFYPESEGDSHFET